MHLGPLRKRSFLIDCDLSGWRCASCLRGSGDANGVAAEVSFSRISMQRGMGDVDGGGF